MLEGGEGRRAVVGALRTCERKRACVLVFFAFYVTLSCYTCACVRVRVVWGRQILECVGACVRTCVRVF